MRTASRNAWARSLSGRVKKVSGEASADGGPVLRGECALCGLGVFRGQSRRWSLVDGVKEWKHTACLNKEKGNAPDNVIDLDEE